MNRVAKLYTGLIMIAAGAIGMAYVNVQLVPAALSQQSAALASASAAANSAQPPAVETASATQTSTASAAPAPAASSAAAVEVDAGSAGPLAPIKFDLTKVTQKNLSKSVEPLATWLKKNPNEKVILVGHGDPKTRTRDYMEVGRARALTIRRALLEWKVTAARVQVQPAEMEGDKVKGTEEFAGTVEVRSSTKGER